MLNNKVYIKDFFESESMISRQTARELYEHIKNMKSKVVELDFRDVKYASRSFFDELNCKMGFLRLFNTEVKIVNLNENLSRLLDIVLNVKERTYSDIRTVEDVEIVRI